MAAHKKLPPENAAEDIERLASKGFGQLGIASHLKVSVHTFRKWIEEDEALNEAYELGKETERQALHALVVQSAVLNKSANVNAFFLLKARHGYVETDNRTKVSVDVAVQSVLVVRDYGSNDEWAAKCVAQQKALTAESTPHQIEAPQATQFDAVASFAPEAILPPVYAPVSAPVPVAPSWTPPVKQAAVAPSYAPPGWQPVPGSINAPEPSQSAPIAPSWNSAKWRPRA